MENTLTQNNLQIFCSKILSSFSLKSINDKIYQMFDSLPAQSAVNYIGELNRNDIMH